MAIATAPTLNGIVTEGLSKAGFRNQSAADITRATDTWFQEILNEIWMTSERSGNTRLKTLQTTGILISIDNQRKYDLPTDFDEELTVTVMNSENTGTAQTGAASSVTLAAAETITQLAAEGKYILMTGGTSKGQYQQVISYNATTKVATVDRAWATGKTPVVSDAYAMIDSESEVDEIGIDELDEPGQGSTPGLPRCFAKFGDTFIFNIPFDKATYGIRLRYFTNIHELDLAGTVFPKILKNWRGVLTLGVKMKAEESIKATEFATTKQLFDQSLARLVAKEIPFGGEFEQFTM